MSAPFGVLDLVELERTHERRSRRMTAADRAPGPLVGSAVARDVEAAREAIAVVVERAEEAEATWSPTDPRSTFTPLTDDPNWWAKHRYTFDGAPGLLVKIIRNILYLEDGPLTAYDIAKIVQRRYAGRWRSASIRHKVGEPKTGLFVWDLNGVSDDGEPCRRYWLTEPPA